MKLFFKLRATNRLTLVNLDSTTVYVQNDFIDCAIEILNTELSKVALWFDSNKLTLNLNKTQMIMISLKKILTPQNEVISRNEVVQRVNNVWSSTYRTNFKMLCTAQKRSVPALFTTAQ